MSLAQTREVVSIHVGGAGCNLGSPVWELFCAEHGIDSTGRAILAKEGMNHSNFFYEDRSSGNLKPRSIFIDTEPSLQKESLIDRYGSPIDRLRTG